MIVILKLKKSYTCFLNPVYFFSLSLLKYVANINIPPITANITLIITQTSDVENDFAVLVIVFIAFPVSYCGIVSHPLLFEYNTEM